MSNGTISRAALEAKVRGTPPGFRDGWTYGYWKPKDKSFLILDPVYSLPGSEDVRQFLLAARESIKSEDTHSTNIWDCDNFSRYLVVEASKYASKLGYIYKWPLGTVSGYFGWMGDGVAHTCNWVYLAEFENIDPFRPFALIEPQSLIDHQYSTTYYLEEEGIPGSIRLMIV